MPKKPLKHRRQPQKDKGDLAFQVVIGVIVVMAAIVCGSLAADLIYR